MIKEFREFIARGNVMDLAVGVIIGAAFGAIVTSLVNDIIMPVIGVILGNLNFVDFFISLNGQAYPSLKAAKDAGAPVLAYGNFITVLINFLIVAFVIFLLVKGVNKIRREPPPAPAAPPAPTKEEALLMEIRDLLKTR